MGYEVEPYYGHGMSEERRTTRSANLVWGALLLVVVAVTIGALAGSGVFSGGGGAADNGNGTPSPTVDPANCPVAIGQEIRNGNDYIGLVFLTCPSDAALQAFEGAAARWSGIISQNKISAVSAGQNFNSKSRCGFMDNNIVISGNLVFDHLLILAENVDIDGVNGVLGASSPCLVSGQFSILGGMQFDNADLDNLQREGTLDEVIEHEMGHVLGIGSLWTAFSQNGGAVSAQNLALLQDPIFTVQNGQLVTNVNNVPKFIGTSGRAEFATLAGVAQEAFVPVEDGRQNGQFKFFHPDITNGDGRGSIDAHWKIETFDNELMTFAISPNDAQHPLSRISISSLADYGYAVDLNKADNFALPKATTANLRASKELIYFGNDVPMRGDDIKDISDIKRFEPVEITPEMMVFHG